MNFKSFIVPGLALVYGLICGFLIGYDKLGGERSVDWAAVAGFSAAFTTLIGAIAVLWVYSQWKNQKGAEVVANEAKNFILTLSEFQRLQGEVYRGLEDRGGYYLHRDKITELKECKTDLSNSSAFLGFALNDEELTRSTSNILSKVIKFNMDVNECLSGDVNLNQIKKISPHEAQELKYQLLEYALYKKKIKYINKLSKSLSHLPK